VAYILEHGDVGHSDRYLPSRDELNKLYLNGGWIGGVASSENHSWYWSSSEGASNTAWCQVFCNGKQDCVRKSGTWYYNPGTGRGRAGYVPSGLSDRVNSTT
jgi:hypothetical protein